MDRREQLLAPVAVVLPINVERLVTGDEQWFDRVLTAARDLHRERAGILIDALHEQLPGAFETQAPEGVLFLWPRLADDAVDPAALYQRAAANGVVYQQGEFFAASPQRDSARHLRFANGDRTPDELREAVRRLALAF
ncbi:hypothetical protein ACFO1B_16510 [Dactylosporangium siamense]|uniref:hypothetical protein n=1 Tax=Dactylosporangium siamense TaxID=685454 RepID=UPI001944AA48|nr:hypothetical protein [Dactylosporangium siamense]